MVGAAIGLIATAVSSGYSAWSANQAGKEQAANIKRQSQKAEDAEGIGGISFNRWQVYLAAAGVLVGVFALFKR